jgi:hypothetical protein
MALTHSGASELGQLIEGEVDWFSWTAPIVNL